MLDCQEYLHLAVNAMVSDDNHAALDYLHKALELEPDNGWVTFLLASQHASLGLFDRALAGFERSVELEPSNEIAWFQKGLLSTQMDLLDNAKDSFSHLLTITQDAAVSKFCNGLIALIEEKLPESKALLLEGIEIGHENDALIGDMTRLVEEINNKLDEGSAEQPPLDEPKSEEQQNVFLGAYLDKALKN